MKKTYKELMELDQVVGVLYQNDPNLKNTKFGYTYKKFIQKYLQPLVNEYHDELTDMRIEHSLTDPITHQVMEDHLNPRGFKFSKEDFRQVLKKEREIETKWNAREVEIEPYLSAYVPENLTEEQREILTGILI